MPDAVWVTVQRHILTGIRNGTYPAGARLPGISRLAEQLGVSTTSVRAAIAELAASGTVDVRPGGGTFVPAGPAVPDVLADHERRISLLERRRDQTRG